MRERCWKLVASNETAVLAEASLDTIVVEDGQGSGRLSDASKPNKGDWSELHHEANNQLVRFEAGPPHEGHDTRYNHLS